MNPNNWNLWLGSIASMIAIISALIRYVPQVWPYVERVFKNKITKEYLLYTLVISVIITVILLVIIPFLKKHNNYEKEKTVIVVANFNGITEKEKEEGQKVAASIQADLDSKLKEANIETYTKVFPLGQTVLNDVEARKISSEIGESVILLWGQITVEETGNKFEKFFTPKICIVNPPRGMIYPASKKSQIVTNLESFKLESEKLSRQVVNITSLIVGLLHYWDEDYDIAKRFFWDAYSKIEKSDILFYIGNCHYYLSEIDSAIISYKRLLEKSNNAPGAYNNIGICYIEKKKYNLALRYFDDCLEIEPNSHEAWTNKGIVYLRQDSSHAALRCFQKAITIAGCDPASLNNAAIVFMKMEDYETAIRQLEKALTCEDEPCYEIRYNLAVAYVNLNNYEAAEHWYKETAYLFPDSSSVWLNLAITQYKLSKYDKALETLSKLLILNASTSKTYLLFGEIYMSIEDYENAITMFEKALDINLAEGAKEKIYFNLGLAYSKLNQNSRAISYYRTAVNRNPNFYEALYNLIVLELQTENFEEAEKYALQAKKTYPDSVNIVKLLAELYNRTQKPDRALVILEQIDAEDEDSLINEQKLLLQYNRGFDNFKSGNYEQTMEDLAPIIEKTPNDPSANELMGMCQLKVGNPKEALRYYAIALKHGQSTAKLHYNMGLIYHEINDYKNAIHHLIEANRVEEKFIDSYLLLGQIYMNQQQFDNAASTFGVVTQLEPKNADAHYNVGVAYYNMKEYENAISCFEYAIKLNHNKREFHYLLGISALNSNKYKRAIYALQKANKISEGYETYVNLGNAYSAVGNDDDAIKSLRAAIRLKPDGFLAHYNLGVYDANRNLGGDAVSHFESFLQYVNPRRMYTNEIEQAEQYLELHKVTL